MRLLTFRTSFFLLLFLAFSLEAKMLSRTQIVMGTFINIAVEEKDKAFIEDGFRTFKNIDASLSTFNPNSPIYKLNQTKNTPLNTTSYEALLLSTKYYETTDGYFDISIGSITKDLYHFGEEEHLPHGKDMANAFIGFKGLFFNKKNASLHKNMKIDLGGMGKGFAVDKVADYFKDKNSTKAIIAASGDIRCLDTCDIDITNPFSQEPLVSFITRDKNMGISTSGNYNRYVESTKNNHLINPKRKYSQNNFVSITLISHMPSADLDAYTTAASVMPVKESYNFLHTLKTAYIILHV
ncbi:FAD:protein FMN transferase, partial [Sulfurimonas sp. SAG-AH-194-I05]